MKVSRVAFDLAVEGDAVAVAELRNAAAAALTRVHGAGNWSSLATEKDVVRAIRDSQVVLARDRRGIVGTLRLATKKPWAIDIAYFTPSTRPIYLLDMAVEPSRQRQGIGRAMLDEARKLAAAAGRDVVRLDAYAGAAGAAGFYERCGFREVGRVTYRGVRLVYFEALL